jgi:enoyl-[acyl-carrier protein] reductase I
LGFVGHDSVGELKAVFERIAHEWGRLDFVIRAVAFAPKEDLHGPGDARLLLVVRPDGEARRAADEGRRGAGRHELIWRRQSGEPLQHYGVGRVRARGLGPLHRGRTRSEGGAIVRRVAGALENARRERHLRLDELVQTARERAPAQRLVDIAELGRVVAFLVGGASSGTTGDTIYIDGGLHNMA